MNKHFTRMGDGTIVYMTEEEIRADIYAGVSDAAMRGKIPPLSKEEMEHLYQIITMPGIIVGVDYGKQVVSTTDQGADTMGTESAVGLDRAIQVQILERCIGSDSTDIGFTDYNFKAVKPIVTYEAAVMQRCLSESIIPVLYGGMPNLGFYTKPDGPIDNWAELLPAGKVNEALAAQEEAVSHAVRDIVYVAEKMYYAGADGINLDTCGAAGDADFLAALKSTEEIKRKFPDLGVEIGMAGEFVLGMHGKLTYDGVRLAGAFPHQQVKLAEKAGATIFGPVVNTNSNKSFAWNIARTCTFIKACVEVANIPVHPNVGMGVGGIPMCEVIPCDVVSRADKALIEICKIDGL